MICLLGNRPHTSIIFTHKLKKDLFLPKFKLALSDVEPSNLVFREHELWCPRSARTWLGPTAQRAERPAIRPRCYFWPASPRPAGPHFHLPRGLRVRERLEYKVGIGPKKFEEFIRIVFSTQYNVLYQPLNNHINFRLNIVER